MVEAARDRLAPFGDRVTYAVADLGRPLPLEPRSVDAILSTATFHWVPDHEALFANLAPSLRPGGRLVAQCGGAGNIAAVLRGRSPATGDGWPGPWTFATPEETRARLEAAGFIDIETWLNDELEPFEPGEPFREYLRTVVLGAHLERLATDAERDAFVDAVADAAPRRRRSTTCGSTSSRPAPEPGATETRSVATRNGPPWPGITMSAAASTRSRSARSSAWSSAERVHLGRPVLAPPQVRHRVDRVVRLDDERRVLRVWPGVSHSSAVRRELRWPSPSWSSHRSSL